MTKANYMAIDQYNHTYHNLGPHPRKELMRRLAKSRAAKMYVDRTNKAAVHIGWIIGGLWLTVFKVERMERPA